MELAREAQSLWAGIMDVMLNTFMIFQNVILMLGFYIIASATHLFMFGFENTFHIDG